MSLRIADVADSLRPRRSPGVSLGRVEPVLVVDDDPTVPEVVTGHLGRAGFALDVAADGPTAVARATCRQPTWWCWI